MRNKTDKWIYKYINLLNAGYTVTSPSLGLRQHMSIQFSNISFVSMLHVKIDFKYVIQNLTFYVFKLF